MHRHATYALIVLLASSGCRSLPPPQPPRWISLGQVRVDTANREILLHGQVNMADGLIEVLACGTAGKTHESLLLVPIRPMNLQSALLLLGLSPGTDPTDLGVGAPSGPEMDLWVEWDVEGGVTRQRAEHLIIHRETGGPLPETGWVFTGSQVLDGAFMADMDDSLVATFWEPWAIMNLPLPCGADDTLLTVNENLTPPEGTPIRLRMSVRP